MISWQAWVLAAIMAISTGARAEFVVAQVAPMSGPIGVEGLAYNSGIRVALAAVNANGGVHGQSVNLVTEDDEYNPDKTLAAVARLGRGSALALLLPVGSPALTKLLTEKALESAGLPVIGVVPGAEPFRKPHHPYLYHVRAGDADQYRKIIEHSLTVGLKRIAVVYVDIPFGKSGLAIVEGVLKAHGMEPVARAAIALTGPETVKTSFGVVSRAHADLVLLITPAKRAGEYVAAARDHGLQSPINTLSYGNADTICSVASAEKARGVGLAQVFPNIRNRGLKIVREYLEDFGRFGAREAKPSLMQFEGYVAARVFLEGLRRTGKAATRNGLMRALDSMRNFDLGGFVVDFSETKHNGSAYVDLSIIGRECQLVY